MVRKACLELAEGITGNRDFLGLGHRPAVGICHIAIEHFTGPVRWEAGLVGVQLSGVMNKGDAQVAVMIVPDPGAGELVGVLRVKGMSEVRLERLNSATSATQMRIVPWLVVLLRPVCGQ